MNNHRKSLTFLILGVFITIFSFTFLTKNFATHEHPVQAATLDNFRPGNIISDYVMSNYNSMSEAEIQSFLKSKNHCNDTNISKATKYPNLHYHIKDGHFVCLADELFGNGTNYGGTTGETAAHIIWQAAQDYHINPQVLLVLLQKEQGLITDTWPNHIQYRSATGYGCPDTAACNSEYYGFKNQISKAAQLFRTVLNGGWTNYPLGNNFIQYNPNKACGGSIVNIENLATSSLYRYTPYQPNAGALTAGTGTAYCGAYGNRNFYLYFSNWFGDPTKNASLIGEFSDMVIPRLLSIKQDARYIEPVSGQVKVRSDSDIVYFSALSRSNNKLCLSIDKNRNCYLYDDLTELEFDTPEPMVIKRMLITKSRAKYLNLSTSKAEFIPKNTPIIFNKKNIVNNKLCLSESSDDEHIKCILYSNLEELPEIKYSDMVIPRRIFIKPEANEIDTTIGIPAPSTNTNMKLNFTKMTSWLNQLCLQYEGSKNKCILYTDLKELEPVEFSDMVIPRYLRLAKNITYYDDIEILSQTTRTTKQEILFFDKLVYINNKLCLKAKHGDDLSCILFDSLIEIKKPDFNAMDIPRKIRIKKGANFYNSITQEYSAIPAEINDMYFIEKAFINNHLCLRSRENNILNDLPLCVFYEFLDEY